MLTSVVLFFGVIQTTFLLLWAKTALICSYESLQPRLLGRQAASLSIDLLYCCFYSTERDDDKWRFFSISTMRSVRSLMFSFHSTSPTIHIDLRRGFVQSCRMYLLTIILHPVKFLTLSYIHDF